MTLDVLTRRSDTDSASQAADVQPSSLNFAVVVTAIFFAVGLYNVSSHVLWRDELRFWQLATISPTFSAMRTNMQFEGAPWLWYGSLWLLSRLTTNVFAMQLLHVLIASGTVFLFACRAPFSRAGKLLFPFGYFTLFEYATISRSYAVALLLVVAAAAVITLPRRRPVLLGCILFLLTQTNIWGVGIAGVMLLSALLEWTIFKPASLRNAGLRLSWPKATMLGCVVMTGSVTCYVSCLPGPGDSFVARWEEDEPVDRKLAATLGGFWKGMVPIPVPKRTYWNSNVLDGRLELRCIGACLLIATAVLLFLRRPAALVPLVVGSAGLMWFTLFHFVGAVRHDGLYFVLVIAAFWIGATATRIAIPLPRLAQITRALESRSEALLVGLLAIHAVVGVGVSIADHRLPFSASKQIADHVRRELPDDTVLVGFDDYSAAAVGFYADRPIHSVQSKTQAEFFTQDDRLRKTITEKLLVEELDRLLKSETRDFVVILSPHRDNELTEWYEETPHVSLQWELLGRFFDSTVKDEGSVLYRVRRADAAPRTTGPVSTIVEPHIE